MPNPVTKNALPEREHERYRKVTLTIEFLICNPNPPHVFDCTDQQLEERLASLASQTVEKSLPYDPEKGIGFVAPDFVAKEGKIGVNVVSRECDESGKISLWRKIVYLLTGRYSR